MWVYITIVAFDTMDANASRLSVRTFEVLIYRRQKSPKIG